MNFREAVIRGGKIRCTGWNEGEYMEWDDEKGCFLDEDGFATTTIQATGEWEAYGTILTFGEACEALAAGETVLINGEPYKLGDLNNNVYRADADVMLTSIFNHTKDTFRKCSE